MKITQRGFTLIELLVVVLIIGILASVALPQYQKAVRKARLSEVATVFSSVSRGIDMWLLENGYPSSTTYFSGINKGAGLDIASTCSTEDNDYCYTSTGRWGYGCTSAHCQISLTTNYHADKTTGNNWLDQKQIFWFKKGDDSWGLQGSSIASPSVQREICRWWRDLYGAERMQDSNGNFDSTCNAYF